MNTGTRRHQHARQHAVALYSGVLTALMAILVFLITTDVIVIVAGQSPITAGARLLLVMVLMLCVVLYFGKSIRGMLALPEIPLLLALAVASFLWSYQPLNTLERAIPLVGTTVFAILLGSILSLRKLIIFFAIVSAITMIVSLLAIATLPGARGIPPWENTWNGVFNHKNGLGGASTLSLIFTVFGMTVTKGRLRRFFGFCAVLSLVLLIASESRSAQIVALITIGGAGSYILMKRMALIWSIGYFGAILSFIAFTGYLLSTDVLAPLFEAVDRKPTLSGRLPLWTVLGPYISDEFWLGYGYAGFWDPTSPRVLQLSARLGLGFIPFYSHNGLLETWLHLGLLGVSVLIAALIRIGRACYTILRQNRDRTAIISIVVVILAFVLMNTTEGSILARTSLKWMTFVAFGTKACVLASIVNTKPRRHKSRTGQTQTSYAPMAIEE